MRILLISLVLMSTTMASFGQKFQIKWGPEYKKEGGLFSWDYLLGNDEKYFYALSDPRGKGNLLKFDFNCKLVSSAPFKLELGKGKTSVSDMLRAGVRSYVTLVNRDKKAGVVNYFYTEMKNGNFSSTVKNFYALALDYAFLSDFKTSPNGEYVAGLATSRGKNKEEVLKAVVFDNSLKVSWEKTFPLKITDRHIHIETYTVDNNGNIYVSAKHYDSGEAYKKGLPKYKYMVYKLSSNGDKTETEVELGGDKAPWDAGMFPAAEGGVYVGGFYTKTTTPKGSADGVFIGNVTDGKAKANSFAFTEEFLQGLQTKKQDKKDMGITSFNVDYLVKLPDGTLTFIAEKFYITTYTTSNGKTTTTHTVYHTNEIVAPRFSPDGKLISMDKVDKVFSSENPSITSYSFFVKDNSVVLVYNDFKTREERKASGKGRAIYTDISFISGNGSVKTENIFTSKDVEKYYIPGASLDLGNGKHIVKAIKGKTYVYGIISL